VIEIIHLIQTKETQRDSAILLSGYINYHEMTCLDDDCPLKVYKRHHMNKHIGRDTTNSRFINNESNSLLLNYTKKLMERSLRKFPTCVALRIGYASFLLDNIGNKREAMRELHECTKQSPTFYQQFIVYRYKKLIGDSLLENGKDQGGLEYLSAMNFDSHYRKCKGDIERTSLLYFELWNHLQEETPDLKRLMDLGTRINEELKVIDVHWRNMQSIFPNTPKAVKLYSMFLIEVVNDKETGNELLKNAKESSKLRVDMGGGDISGGGMQDGSPLVYLSGETDRMGHISNLNLSACRIFGYFRREDLLNQNVKILMPSIYAHRHDEIVRNACMRSAEQFSNRERNVFGKHTSGFIFPVSLQMRYFQSFLHGK